MEKTIKKFLRRWFNCNVLDHEWVVAYWRINQVLHWDSRTWKCLYCPKWVRTGYNGFKDAQEIEPL